MGIVNEKRIVTEFIELASMDSPSFNERKVADCIISKATSMGLDVYEDKGGETYGGNTGNLYFTLSGASHIPSLMLLAHMDTVVPCKNKKIKVEGDIIKSDGSTILGSDDVAGIVEIFETLRVLKEQDIKHGNIEVVFTIGEEKSLCGAKVLEYDRIKSKIALVLDSGGLGRAAISGPSQYQLEVTFLGKAAHAGIEPEKGNNAIIIASNAISKMKLGRIDFETTANVGVINGGEATNIVCDRCEVHFEARSRNKGKLEAQVSHMKEVIEAAAKDANTKVEIKQDFLYPEFNIPEDDDLVQIFLKSCMAVGIEGRLEATGGGSDTNIISGKGIKAIDLACGMENVHTLEEYIKISSLVKSTEILVKMVELIYDSEVQNG